MQGYEFSLSGVKLIACPRGVLWIPASKTLVVSDLHLGKAERIARREGRLTPPYEALETIERLTEAVDQLRPAEVVCLGDSFDDSTAALDIEEDIALSLMRLMAGRSWIWIMGNHDPEPSGLGGTYLDQYHVGPIVFRHIALKGARGEISGHYHPKVWLRGRGRASFIIDDARVILPAFGTYTGGLDAASEVFDDLFSQDALALLTGARIIPTPRSKLPKRRRLTPHRLKAV